MKEKADRQTDRTNARILSVKKKYIKQNKRRRKTLLYERHRWYIQQIVILTNEWQSTENRVNYDAKVKQKKSKKKKKFEIGKWIVFQRTNERTNRKRRQTNKKKNTFKSIKLKVYTDKDLDTCKLQTWRTRERKSKRRNEDQTNATKWQVHQKLPLNG